MRTNNRIRVVCVVCESENVMLDAWAEWDFENQCWTLCTTGDEAWCGDCDGEVRLQDKEMEIPLA